MANIWEQAASAPAITPSGNIWEQAASNPPDSTPKENTPSTPASEFGKGFFEDTAKGIIASAKSLLPKFTTPSEQLEIEKRTHDLIDKGQYGEAAKQIFSDVMDKIPGGGLIKGIVHSSIDQAGKAKDAWDRGDKAEAALHAASAIPVMGTMAAGGVDTALGQPAKYDKYGNILADAVPPNPWRAAGGATAQAAMVAAPRVAQMLPKEVSVAPAKVLSAASPQRAPVIALADAENIPLTLGQRTGNRFLRNVEASAASTPGTTGLAEDAKLATTAAMQKTASSMASEVDTTAATPESSGAGVSSELSKSTETHANAARSAYSKLADIENDPANLKSVQIGTEINPDIDKLAQQLAGKPFQDLNQVDQQKIITAAPSFQVDPTPKPIMKDIALPVDMRPVKTDLKALSDELKQQMPIAQQQSSRGLKAIENIMSGEDHVPASVADANLSAVKAIQREAVNAKSKFLAGKAITAFSPAVDDAVAGAGTEAADALAQGRAMTKAKYATQETLDNLPTEPVRLFNTLTAKGDVGINLLRDVAQKAPGSMKAVGRAYIEGLLDSASGVPGSTAGPDAAFSSWNKLGDSTKEILFPDPVFRSRVDAFMSLAKDVATNPNPSGTAFVQAGQLFLKHPVTGALYAVRNNALSRMLFNPQTAKTLVDGMRIPVSSKAASLATFNQMLKAAGSDAVKQDVGVDHDYAVGQEVDLRGVGKVTIKKINPDGTFEY